MALPACCPRWLLSSGTASASIRSRSRCAVIPLGYAYALWCGIGIVVIVGVGYFYYRQPVDLAGMFGVGLIMAGVAVLNLFSKMAVR